MDNFYLALSLYRRKKFENCVALCSELLEKNPYDQVSNYKTYPQIKYDYMFQIFSTLDRCTQLFIVLILLVFSGAAWDLILRSYPLASDNPATKRCTHRFLVLMLLFSCGPLRSHYALTLLQPNRHLRRYGYMKVLPFSVLFGICVCTTMYKTCFTRAPLQPTFSAVY